MVLYSGDNLVIMQKFIPSESVDLCYIDPPFNSNKDYFGDIAGEKYIAFSDRWQRDDVFLANMNQIMSKNTKLSQLVNAFGLISNESTYVYLTHLSARLIEIHRALKSTGSLYLHCDSTTSHYIKLILDILFVSDGGEFQNELVWSYRSGGASKKRFAKKHDTIFFYTKSHAWTFNAQKERSYMAHTYGFKKSDFQIDEETGRQYSMVYARDVLELPSLGSDTAERTGYPTQKPEALLERIIMASSNEGDVVLDAYCGCGTTLAVAERLKRQWIGIDSSPIALTVTAKRLMLDQEC